MRKLLLALLSLVMVFSFVACGDVDNNKNSGDIVSTNKENNETKVKYANVKQNPIVTMDMGSGDIVKMELYPQIAPTTVENFISLINDGFYDGLIFHRVIPTFMAQGGDPSGDGTGDPGYSIKGEFSANGVKNDLSHEVGVVSMARAQEYDSAGSQFFIVTNENSYVSLDTQYAAFGKVIEGMDVVNKIVNADVIRRDVDEEVYKAAVDVSMKINSGVETTIEENLKLVQYYTQAAEVDRPINPPIIKKMSVETFGVKYEEPAKITK